MTESINSADIRFRVKQTSGILLIAVVYNHNEPLKFFLDPKKANDWMYRLGFECPEWQAPDKQLHVVMEELILGTLEEEQQ